ncbi:hypothetical protein EB796_014549 [Bugula neritina]|uniref:Uncharacterized protein n=1 Tax=Bugula neritina TaxID=10212 RepID=A0A7J7JP13_BUGNE|nr:hypothetical protein EB796_014549 [Bugula neritina]
MTVNSLCIASYPQHFVLSLVACVGSAPGAWTVGGLSMEHCLSQPPAVQIIHFYSLCCLFTVGRYETYRGRPVPVI